MPTPEQSFARFRATGDAAALAAVFDAVATELLLIAAHLAPRGSDAEDLVQATFVTAIENADCWDAQRRLVPWLAGILVNQAREDRRRAARQPDAARLKLDDVRDPLAEAELHEASDRVLAALRDLPTDYRQVLTLRLVHGLTPTEIAHALDQPIATVKTRLQRGLARLRSALPAGIGAAVMAIAVSGRGLASVRQAALAHVPATIVGGASVAGSVASVTGGVLVKKALIAVGAAVLCVTVWMAWPSSEPAARSTSGVASPGTSASPTGATLDSARVETVERQETPASHVRVRGRCLHAFSKEPVQGIHVQAAVGPRDETPGASRCVTDHEGRFVLELPPGAAKALALDLSTAGGRRIRRLTIPAASDPAAGFHDLGDVCLHVKQPVAGTVRDEAGAPVPNAGFQALRPRVSAGGQRWITLTEDVVIRAGRDGTFSLEMECGPWRLQPVDGRTLVSPERLDVGYDPHRSQQVALIVKTLTAADTITGTVVDDLRRPIADVKVVALGGRRREEAVTDAAGRFQLIASEPGQAPAPLWVPSGFVSDQESEERRLLRERYPYKEHRSEQCYRWGTADLQIVLESAGTLELCVTSGDTGEPIEAFSVQCLHHYGAGYRTPVRRWPGGTMRLTGVQDGKNVLFVHPADERYLPSEPYVFEKSASGPRALHVKVWRAVGLEVVVVEEGTRQPIADTTVEVVQGNGFAAIELQQVALSHDEMGKQGSGTAYRLARGRTDAKGHVDLRVPSSAGNGVELHVLGPGHPPVVRPVAWAGPKRVEVEVPQSCSLSGKVTGPGAEDVPGLRLLCMGYTCGPQHAPGPLGLPMIRAREHAPYGWFTLDEERRFRITGIPSGRHQVLLVSSTSRQPGHELPPAAVITLKPGEHQDLVLAAPARKGTIRGVVSLDGKPLARAIVALRGRLAHGLEIPGGWSTETNLGDTTNRLGEFTIENVSPIEWNARVIVGENRDQTTLLTDDWFQAKASEERVLMLDLPSSGLEVVVVDAREQPVHDVNVDVHRGQPGWMTLVGQRTTDGEGRAIVRPLAPGRYTVTGWPLGWEARRWTVPSAEWASHRVRLGEAVIGNGERGLQRVVVNLK